MKLHLPVMLLASFIFLPGCVSTTPNTSSSSSSSPIKYTPIVQQTPESVTSNWYTYTSKNGSYTALFPTQPKETTQTQNTAVGNVDYIIATHENKLKGTAYLTSDAKYNVQVPDSSVETVLDSVRDGALKADPILA